MMAKSTLMAILFWGSCVIGTFQFKYVNGERSSGKSYLPHRQRIHSPSYAPLHAPSSHPLYHSSTMATEMEQTNSASHENHHLRVLILAAIIFAPFLIGAILLFAYCSWVHKRNSNPVHPPSQAQAYERQVHIDGSDGSKGISLGPLINRLSSFRITKRRECASAIDYLVLQEATNNFSSYNLLGKGGFGCVYQAQFHDGFCAAVKKLNDNRQQAEEEFQALKGRSLDAMTTLACSNMLR